MAILYWEPASSATKPAHGRHVLLWIDTDSEQDFCIGYWDEHSQEGPCFRSEGWDQAVEATHWRYVEGPDGQTPTHYSVPTGTGFDA